MRSEGHGDPLPGRNVQTEAMDTLLRLIRDVPGSIEYLRRHAA